MSGLAAVMLSLAAALEHSEEIMGRFFFCIGALSACAGVAAGAFGAHGLEGRLTNKMLSIFEIGVRYQMYHALALLAVAWAQTYWSSRLLTIGGWFFILGTILFSGSLYVLSVSGLTWLGAITPVGGMAFLAGWVSLAWAAWRG